LNKGTLYIQSHSIDLQLHKARASKFPKRHLSTPPLNEPEEHQGMASR
jgi:hypothetical protein